MNADTDTTAPRPLGFWTTLGSVLAAFFGVQSGAARRRDFSRGSAIHFIAVALGMTAVLVLGLILLVQWLLRTAGSA